MNTAIATATAGASSIANFAGYVGRPVFAYKDADEVYIGAGRYHHSGTSEQMVYWQSQLTFQIGPGGSNAGSSAAPTSGMIYFYIDDSAVVAAGTNLLTASEFVAVTTAPAWDAAKGGWYNGDDRFMFAIPTNSSAQLVDFYHDGGRYLKYTGDITDRSDANISSTANVTISVPDFGDNTSAQVTFRIRYDSASASLYWRKGGTTNNHWIGRVYAASVDQSSSHHVFTDSSQVIQLYAGNAGGSISVITNGYYFPGGA